jgi:hypothetical protein
MQILKYSQPLRGPWGGVHHAVALIVTALNWAW